MKWTDAAGIEHSSIVSSKLHTEAGQPCAPAPDFCTLEVIIPDGEPVRLIVENPQKLRYELTESP